MTVLKRASAEGAGSPGIGGFGIASGPGDIDCRVEDELMLIGAGDTRGDCVGSERGGEYGGGESYASELKGDQPHLSRHARTRSNDRARSIVNLRPSPITSCTMLMAVSNSALVLLGGRLGEGCDSGSGEREANTSRSGPGIGALTRCLCGRPRGKLL